MEKANEALLRQTAHEQLCTERWNELRHTMERVRTSVNGLFWIILISAGTLIIGMGSIIATVVLHGH